MNKKMYLSSLFIIVTILIIVAIMFTLMVFSQSKYSRVETPEATTNTLIETISLIENTEIIEKKPTKTIVPTEIESNIPTLQPENVKIMVEDNLLNNAGCRLPCWWGVEPGKTDFQTAINIFNILDSTGELRESIVNTGTGKSIEYSKGFHYPYNYISDEWQIAWLVSGIDGIVTKLTIASKIEDQFEFSSIFDSLGMPDEVKIATFSDVPGYPSLEPYLPFGVVMIYEEDQLILWYRLQGQNIDNTIIACQENSVITMWIWDEEILDSGYKAYVLNIAGGEYLEGSQYLHDITEVTNMNIEQFVNRIKENPDACLETPAKYW